MLLPAARGPRYRGARTVRRARRRSRSRPRSRTPSALPRRVGRAGTSERTASSIGSGPHAKMSPGSSARSSVTSRGSTTTVASGRSSAASACRSLRKPSIAGASTQRLGEVRHRSNSDPAGDEQRALDVEVEAVSEWSENVDRLAGLERAERARARSDRVDQECELARRRLTKAHRAWQQPSRRLEHEELPWNARLERYPGRAGAACTGRSARDRHGQALATRVHASIPIRSWSDRADSALAFAIACTAAAAPEIVVTHGTRAASAASRMR